MRQFQCLLFAALMSAASTVTTAHHSVAAYRNNSEEQVTGVVSQVDWSFPHVYIEILGRMEGSKESGRWLVEADNPAMLRRVGLSRSTLRIGEVVTLTVRPPVDTGSRIAFLVAV